MHNKDTYSNIALFALSANVDLAKKIANFLGIPLSERNIVRFPSGEVLVEPVESVRGKRVFIVNSTCPPVNENLMETLIFIDALKRASASEINLICPYFGYARQDRKAKPRQPITAALVAKLLGAAGVSRVITVNLHAAQIQGFFPCLVDDLTAIPLLGARIKTEEGRFNYEDLVVVSPDQGGVKRARDLAVVLRNRPIAMVDKRRNEKLEPEALSVIGDVNGKIALMVDDMLDTCRTMHEAAKALKARGARKVLVAAVHPVLSDPAYEILSQSDIDGVLVSDSIPLPERFQKLAKFQVVSISMMLGEVIDRVINSTALSDMYEAYANIENTDKIKI